MANKIWCPNCKKKTKRKSRQGQLECNKCLSHRVPKNPEVQEKLTLTKKDKLIVNSPYIVYGIIIIIAIIIVIKMTGGS